MACCKGDEQRRAVGPTWILAVDQLMRTQPVTGAKKIGKFALYEQFRPAVPRGVEAGARTEFLLAIDLRGPHGEKSDSVVNRSDLLGRNTPLERLEGKHQPG